MHYSIKSLRSSNIYFNICTIMELQKKEVVTIPTLLSLKIDSNVELCCTDWTILFIFCFARSKIPSAIFVQSSKLPPPSTSKVADVLRRLCPVYNSGFESFRYFAISFPISPILLIPILCIVHFPFW